MHRRITAFGTHVPYWRLTGETVCSALGAGPARGTRSVAGCDEDTTTMAVEAARGALHGRDRSRLDSIILATGSPTYAARTNATTVHAALGLAPSTSAMDVGGAERSAFAALLTAMSLPGEHLVVLADSGVGAAGSADEIGLGDGAAAFVVGNDDGRADRGDGRADRGADGGDGSADAGTGGGADRDARDGAGDAGRSVELLATASLTEEFLDRWKAPGETFANTWEERFGQEIYERLGAESLDTALGEAGLAVADLDRFVCTGLSRRAVKAVAQECGVEGILAEDLTAQIGRLGVAHAGVLLADALEQAGEGELIALTLLADGAQTAILRVGGSPARTRKGSPASTREGSPVSTREPAEPPTVRDQIAAGNDALRYTDFLNWKGLLSKVGPRRPAPSRADAPPSHRELGWKFAFTADACSACGTRNLPPQRVCLRCGAVDAMEPVSMADVPGTIATFTIDHLAFSPAPPVIGVVIDFDGGGRFPCQLTDADPAEVAIGQRVTMTFRVMSEAAGITNYFWKARPLRGTDETPVPLGRDGK